jgi:CRP-like cAMP-binding protein
MKELDARAFLAHLPLFQGLEAAERARLAEGTTRRRLRAGETLFRQGEPSSGGHAVVHGRIALTVRGERGEERVSDILGPGRSFGEAILFLEKPYIVSARALSDALLLHVAKETVFAELERNPRFARRIIAALSAKLEATVRELESYALGSGSRRFVAWLLRAARGGAAGAAEVMLPASKKAVATKLNLSAEHLSRILRELAGGGLIEVAGRTVRVPDLEKLSRHQASGRAPKPRVAPRVNRTQTRHTPKSLERGRS